MKLDENKHMHTVDTHIDIDMKMGIGIGIGIAKDMDIDIDLSIDISYKLLEAREGKPRQPNKAYLGLFWAIGFIRAYWEDFIYVYTYGEGNRYGYKCRYRYEVRYKHRQRYIARYIDRNI